MRINAIIVSVEREGPPWRAEALRLRAMGYGQSEIARRVGVSQQRVSKVLVAPAAPADDDLSDEQFIKPHRPRTIRSVINRAAIPAAAMAFATGVIDRAELMRQVSA
ncbi:MAG TPA: hypothetical protein VEF90_17695 [Xanthobacteraceae bacterium]|nr:hypothetical protein [Xanthobacteraceae bacterium]